MVEGATAHGRERSTDQLVCIEVPPAPVYKGARGRPAGPLWEWKGGILLPVGVGLPRARHIRGSALPLLHSFIYGGGGTP